jgi:hypothetical protein
MKSTIFWEITPCSPLKINRRFGGTCRLHFHGRKIIQAINQCESRWQAELLLGIFFDPDYGSDIFLRNVGWISTGYTALYSRRWLSLFLISQCILLCVFLLLIPAVSIWLVKYYVTRPERGSQHSLWHCTSVDMKVEKKLLQNEREVAELLVQMRTT